MRIILLILIFYTNTFLYSQNKEMSYYFDSCTEYNQNQYDIKLYSKINHFRNTKDSTYSMSIFQKKDSVYASLYDHNKNILVNFSVDFKYNNVNDFEKLNNIRLFQNVAYSKGKKYKKYIEDFEYENDSVNNQTLVHLTQYKNSKRKKIINEHYYYFSNKDNIKSIEKNNMKDYLIRKYNLLEIKNKNLEKSICVVDGKKQSENEILKITKIDYTFSFTPDQVFPKTYLLSNIRTIYNTTQ